MSALADSYSEQILGHLELEWNSSDITHLLLHFITYAAPRPDNGPFVLIVVLARDTILQSKCY